MRAGAALLAWAAGAAALAAEPGFDRWTRIAPVVTSGDLAVEGWSPISSAGLSWSDGRQTVITFWRSPDGARILRCTDHFNDRTEDTGGSCSAPRGRDD